MIFGPNEKTPSKMKAEYVYLRILNQFSGLRSEGNFDTEVVTPMINTCEEIINIIDETFDGKFKIKTFTGTPTHTGVFNCKT